MCSTKSKVFLVALALVLVSAQVWALWPSWLGGDAGENQQIRKLELQLQEKEQLVQELEASIERLKTASDEQMSSAEAFIQELKVALLESKNEVEMLQTELETLRALTNVESDMLEAAVEEDPVNPFGGMLGAGAIYDPGSGDIAVELSGGLSYGSVLMELGIISDVAEDMYKPEKWRFSAGVKLLF